MRGPAGYLVHSCIALDTHCRQRLAPAALRRLHGNRAESIKFELAQQFGPAGRELGADGGPGEESIALSEDGSMGMEIVLMMAKASVRALVCADDNDEVDVVFELG
jgi:hypothetical protein